MGIDENLYALLVYITVFMHLRDVLFPQQRLAVQYMRELKSRSRDSKDSVPFECKICKTKTFTAVATLMYHYRSHAGESSKW